MTGITIWLRIVPLGLLIACLPGCGSPDGPAAPKSVATDMQPAEEDQSADEAEPFEGVPLDDIVAVYRAAERDGQYRTRVLKVMHPKVVAEIGDELFYRDVPEEKRPELAELAARIESTSHELKDFSNEEWERASKRAKWPVRPTHTLVMATKYKPSAEGGTTAMKVPVNLVRIGDDDASPRYAIVEGRPLTNDDLVGPFPADRIGYRKPALYLAHEWNVPVEAGAATHYRLELQTEAGDAIATLLSADHDLFDDEDRRTQLDEATFVRIGIGNEGVDLKTSDDWTSENATNIATSFQLGRFSGFVSESVPLTEIVFVSANTKPQHIERDGLRLYTITGTRDGEAATYHAVLVKRKL